MSDLVSAFGEDMSAAEESSQQDPDSESSLYVDLLFFIFLHFFVDSGF
jgi:hypothetical protein